VTDLDKLLDGIAVGLVELLGVELDVGLARQELDHRAHQDHAILYAVNRAPRLQ
jgi:hypothetical protein